MIDSIDKSGGVSDTERLLANICEKTFLKLWSYPNPYKFDGHEMCDLIVVFDNHVFLFFDRYSSALDNYKSGDFMVAWNRWRKTTIDKQIKTVVGAERYLKNSKNKLFLDAKCLTPFPIQISREKAIVHKIIVAHGAANACKNYSDDNVSGSLAITYKNQRNDSDKIPFHISLKNKGIIHVFDSESLEIIFSELDTISDLLWYFQAKEEAITGTDNFSYCAEEDVLAQYYLNFDDDQKKHFILPKGKKYNGIMIPEGDWKNFSKSEAYKRKKEADKISYFWDGIIQSTSSNALKGVTGGDPDIFNRPSAIKEMAKEPRFHRRALSKEMCEALQNFPKDTKGEIYRHLGLYPSFEADKSYVFLITHFPMLGFEEARKIKRDMLYVACGAAMLKFPNLKTVVGIAIEAPHLNKTIAEDFILMKDGALTPEVIADIEETNKHCGFFKSNKLVRTEKITKQFPD